MRRNTRLLIGVMCVVVGGVACGAPPTGDIELARTNLDKAVAAGATTFAPDVLATARKAQQELDAELTRQEGKWFKSYGTARDLAVIVQAAADKAAADSATAKERAVADATAATGEERLGPDLFRNGNFSAGLQEWNIHPESDAVPSVVAGGPGEYVWNVTYRGGNWSVIAQSVTLKPDTVYVYEATVRTSAPVVALYWQAETGRFFEIDKSYPEWTKLRYVFLTPHWSGEPMGTAFQPVLMKGPGVASIKDLRLSEFSVR